MPVEKPVDISSLLEEDTSDADTSAKKSVLVFIPCWLVHTFTSAIAAFVFIPFFMGLTVNRMGGERIEKVRHYLTAQVTIVGALFGDIAAAVLVIFLSIRLMKNSLRRTRYVDAAWVLGPVPELLNGAVVGILTFIALFGLNVLLLSGEAAENSFVENQIALNASLGMTFVLMINSVRFLISSPIEEMLFRGVVLGGFSKSFGKPVGVLASTIFFVAIHFPFDGWDDIYTYVGLSLVTISLRFKTGAIGPSIACHIAYNFVVLILTAVGISKL